MWLKRWRLQQHLWARKRFSLMLFLLFFSCLLLIIIGLFMIRSMSHGYVLSLAGVGNKETSVLVFDITYDAVATKPLSSEKNQKIIKEQLAQQVAAQQVKKIVPPPVLIKTAPPPPAKKNQPIKKPEPKKVVAKISPKPLPQKKEEPKKVPPPPVPEPKVIDIPSTLMLRSDETASLYSAEIIALIQELELGLTKVWKGPAKPPAGNKCRLVVTIDNKGKAITVAIEQKSSSLAYDIAARNALAELTFPPIMWNRHHVLEL